MVTIHDADNAMAGLEAAEARVKALRAALAETRGE